MQNTSADGPGRKVRTIRLESKAAACGKSGAYGGFFAHTGIVAGMMFVVFFIIEQYNPAMEF